MAQRWRQLPRGIRRTALLGALAGLALGCGADPESASGPETFETSEAIAAAARNQLPAIRSVRLRPEDPRPGDFVTAEVDAVDPDGDRIELVYRWTLDGQRYGDGQSTFQIPETASHASIGLMVTARDGHDASAPVEAQIEVANRPPVVEDVAVEPAGQAHAGDEIRGSARAVDPDGDEVEIHHSWLVDGRPLDEPSLTLPAGSLERGSRVVLEVWAEDDDDESASLQSEAVEIVNTAPEIVSQPRGLDADGAFRYAVEVIDADGDRRMRYRLAEAPEGMTIHWLTGELVWQPTEAQKGKHPVRIEVDDQQGGIAEQSFVLDVDFAPAEAPASPPPAAAAPDGR